MTDDYVWGLRDLGCGNFHLFIIKYIDIMIEIIMSDMPKGSLKVIANLVWITALPEGTASGRVSVG